MREKQTQKQKQQNNDNEYEIKVKLKPFLGMRPGVYLSILYSFILLIIIFFLFFYHGIKNHGSVLIVKTEPTGAAVRVNDVYMGLSGSRIFVPKGTHTIDIVMPGFKTQSAAVEIPGRVFGTRFFPRLCKLEYTLQTAEQSHQGVTAAFALYAADFTSWTFAGEPTVAWQVPMSLSEGAYRVGPYANEAKEELNEILKAASCFVVTKAALRDLIRAKVLMDNKGNAPSPLTLVRSISDALVFFSENREGAAAMFELLPRETVRKIKDSAWYKEIDAQIPLQIENPARRQNFSGLNFIGPNIFNGNTFLISETPVSRSLFENFLNENPEYQEHKTDYFPDEVANLPEIDRNAVTGITWFAAEAFCKWLSLRLPPIMSGNTIRLPTEDEWFWASNHISNTQGSVWEWCANPYAPINIKASPKAIEAVGSPERSLRRLNSNDSKERASLPPDLSSPFVTFRLVIAPTAAITPKE